VQSTDEVVRRQVELGIDVVSDGEMSKNNFIDYIVERLTGFTPFTTPAVDSDEAPYWAPTFTTLRSSPRSSRRPTGAQCSGSWSAPVTSSTTILTTAGIG
jgi:methionine synthase II (cobalamin-independent)